MAGNKGKKRENFFQQNINRLGPNFLDSYPLDKLKLDVVKVFRELARGNIDIDTYGKYFYNPKFLESCISTAAQKNHFHQVSAEGVYQLILQNAQIYNLNDIFEQHKNTANAYGLILMKLEEFKKFGDLICLHELVLNLAKYRYYI